MSADLSAAAPARGVLRRSDKAMTTQAMHSFLAGAYCGRTATSGRDGFPYVVPNLFVWMEERVYLHTAKQSGHFLANVGFCDRVCFEVDAPGETFPYGPIECDTSIAFRSVVVFGRISIVDDRDAKLRFYEAFMRKYAPPDSWGRPRGTFPRVDATIVYAIEPESMTGKETPLPSDAKGWRPAGAGG
jgi:uncharacterized protein